MFWTALISFLKAAPALWALWKEIKAGFEFASNKIDSAQRIKTLTKAINNANKTKDTSDLDRFFGVK